MNFIIIISTMITEIIVNYKKEVGSVVSFTPFNNN